MYYTSISKFAFKSHQKEDKWPQPCECPLLGTFLAPWEPRSSKAFPEMRDKPLQVCQGLERERMVREGVGGRVFIARTRTLDPKRKRKGGRRRGTRMLGTLWGTPLSRFPCQVFWILNGQKATFFSATLLGKSWDHPTNLTDLLGAWGWKWG